MTCPSPKIDTMFQTKETNATDKLNPYVRHTGDTAMQNLPGTSLISSKAA